MPISGLLITLDRDPALRLRALTALQQHPAIDIGEGEDHRVPIVVDTPSSDDDRAVWDWLHEQPGITFVDVVYVHFDEESDGTRHSAMGNWDADSVAVGQDECRMPIAECRGEQSPPHRRGES